MEHFLQRIHHLLGGVAGPGHHVQFGGVVDVMVHHEFRILYLSDVHQGGERHAGSVRVRDKEAVHLLQAGAVFALRLDIHLPLLAEGIEVIDEGGTVVGGQNAVGHVNIHLVEFAFSLSRFTYFCGMSAIIMSMHKAISGRREAASWNRCTCSCR